MCRDNENDSKQTINSLNNYDVPAETHRHKRSFEQKYRLDPNITNRDRKSVV